VTAEPVDDVLVFNTGLILENDPHELVCHAQVHAAREE
jgi:hypothetical protein